MKMKRFLFFFCVGSLLLFSQSIDSGVYYGVPVTAYTDILFWWRCEGTTLGADDYSEGDTTATLYDNATINTDAVKIGTNGLDIPDGWATARFDIASLVSGTVGRIGFWLYINTWVNGTRLFEAYEDATHLFYVGLYNDDEIFLNWQDGGGLVTVAISTSSPLSTGTDYFIETKYDSTGNDWELFVNGGSVASGSSDEGAISFSSGTMYCGNNESDDGDFYIDNIMISNDKTRDFWGGGTGLCDDTVSPR